MTTADVILGASGHRLREDRKPEASLRLAPPDRTPPVAALTVPGSGPPPGLSRRSPTRQGSAAGSAAQTAQREGLSSRALGGEAL